MDINRHMKKRWVLLLMTAVAVFIFTGCPNLLGETDDSDDSDNNGGGDSSVAESEIYTAATANLATDLAEAGLTPTQIAAITEGAVGSLTDQDLTDSTDTEAVLTSLATGAQSGLSGDEFSDAERAAAIEAIVNSAVGSIGAADTSGSSLFASQAGGDIVGAIVGASVAAIGEAGFGTDTDESNVPYRRIAAGRSARGAVRNLSGAGVGATEFAGTFGSITDRAARSLGAAGYAEDDLPDVIGEITQRTAENADETGVTGLDLNRQLRSVMREISSKATGGIGASGLSGLDEEIIGAAVERIARKATGAIKDVSGLNPDRVASIVEEVSGEVSLSVARSLRELNDNLASAGGTRVNVGNATRRVVRGSVQGLGDIRAGGDETFQAAVRREVIERVVRNSATGAAIADETVDAAALNLGEELSQLAQDETLADLANDLQTVSEEADELVEQGIAARDNAAPSASIAASGDLADGGTFTIGGEVATITLTATIGDEDDDLVRYAWTITRPDGETVDATQGELSLTNGSGEVTLEITPATVGSYTIGITVEDEVETAEATFTFSAEGTLSDLDLLMRSAVDKMEQQNFGGALADFDTILQVDSSYVPAVLGYTLLDVAGILTSREVISLAKDSVGIVEYPSTLSGVLNYDSWTEAVGTAGEVFPAIRNQQDYNGDGTIDVDERFLQAVRNLGASSLASNGVVDAFADGLLSRLTQAVTRLEQVDTESGFDITYNMVYETEQEASTEGWPAAADGSLETITIGAAEINLVISQIQLMLMFNNLAQVIDLSLPWDRYLEDSDGNIRLIFDDTELQVGDSLYNFPALGVLEETNFLELREGATDSLSAAADAFGASVSTMSDALSDVASRGGDFYFGTDDVDDQAWTDFGVTDPNDRDTFLDNAAATLSILDTKIQDSLENGTLVYLPDTQEYPNANGFFAQYNSEANWPTSATEAVTAVNFGAIFNDAARGLSSIFELQSGTREPVFYVYADQTAVEADVRVTEFDATLGVETGGYETEAAANEVAQTASFTAAPATYNSETAYFIKVIDATLGAAEVTQAELDQLNADINVYETEIFTTTGAQSRWEFEGHYLYAEQEADGVAVYIQVPNYYIGHSKVAQGETFEGTDNPISPYADPLTAYESLGDFWWAVLVDVGVIPQKQESFNADPTTDGVIVDDGF